MENKLFKIVYCTPAIYSAGGVERVVTMKANYFAEQYGYDVTIIVTEGKGCDSFFSLSEKVKVINLGINFEELWTVGFIKKIILYIRKLKKFKKKLTSELLQLQPDFTISTLRREINFLTEIRDGSVKIGELHLNRKNFRGVEDNCKNIFQRIFSKLWKKELVCHLKKLDKFVVLSKRAAMEWPELTNIYVIPDPLPIDAKKISNLQNKRVITIGRYSYEKGYDLLLKAWSIVEKEVSDWELDIFAVGNPQPYRQMMKEIGINPERCHLYRSIKHVEREYLNSSLFVLTSRYEGFGLVLIEAMACGLPVVSFDSPCGPKDLITNGKDGVLVESGNVKEFANRLISLMENPEKRKLMSVAARKNALRFDFDRIVSNWKDLFESLYQ